MRTLLALLACFLILVVYVLIGEALGWKNGRGGAIPMVLLILALGGAWKGIRGSGATKDAE